MYVAAHNRLVILYPGKYSLVKFYPRYILPGEILPPNILPGVKNIQVKLYPLVRIGNFKGVNNLVYSSLATITMAKILLLCN